MPCCSRCARLSLIPAMMSSGWALGLQGPSLAWISTLRQQHPQQYSRRSGGGPAAAAAPALTWPLQAAGLPATAVSGPLPGCSSPPLCCLLPGRQASRQTGRQGGEGVGVGEGEASLQIEF